jgi:tetratricopeptide (TPR) repeat protein
MRTIPALAGVLLLAASVGVPAAEPPAIPDRADTEVFKDVSAPWRAYLIQARAAERIADPLQRCLAFPDIPGNHWPAGHAAGHCRLHFAYKAISLAEIAAMIDGGKVAELEGLMDAGLQRHFSEQDFNEDIDNAFDVFVASPESDRVTAKWLELSPDSAYAHLSRAVFLTNSGWQARGGKYASETPRASMRRMSELMGQAIPYFEKAIDLDPKLMPAYAMLINAAMADSRADVESSAFERARKVDPACSALAQARMRALEPRWGGSYEQMLAYANELKEYVSRRPQLAVHIADPFADKGDRLIGDDQYTKSTLEVLDAAVAIGSGEGALHDAADAAANLSDGKPDYEKAVAYLLQESRFGTINAWAARKIAWHILDAEPEWSLKYSLASLETEPDSGYGHYLAGAGYLNTRHFEEADHEYAIAIKDPNQRHDSLRDVANMWLSSGFSKDETARKAGGLRAKPYIDQLLAEYPDDGRGWLMKFYDGIAVDGFIDVDVVRATLKKVDRSDPWQAKKAEYLDEILDQVRAHAKQKH